MSPEAHKATIQRFAQIWNSGDLAALDDLVAAGYVRHDPGLPMPITGPDGLRQLIPLYRAAFPDLYFTAELLLAEGDLVAARWQVRGTQLGELLGIPATGKLIAIAATDIYRFADGKLIEQWVAVDNLGMLQQLGVAPTPGQG